MHESEVDLISFLCHFYFLKATQRTHKNKVDNSIVFNYAYKLFILYSTLRHDFFERSPPLLLCAFIHICGREGGSLTAEFQSYTAAIAARGVIINSYVR